MRIKRIIALLMTVILLAGTAVTAAGPEAGEENTGNLPEIPEVTIVGNDVNGAGEFLEVSLRVRGWRFQSVGVVLSYDTGTLTPVDWTSDARPIAVKTAWTTVVPTKGTDFLSGKPALATIAEQTDTPTVPGAEPEAGEGTEEPTLPAAPQRAYLYLGADALAGLALDDERVVTMRFAVTEGKAVTLPEPGHETEETHTLCLATEKDILDLSVPGAPLLTTTLDDRDEPVSHRYHDVLSTGEDGTETLYTARFVSESGPSVNTGTGSGGGYAITFFDWDGRVIDAISCEEDAAAAVEAWQQHAAIQARLSNKSGYEFDQWLVVYENNDGEGLHTKGGTFTSNDMALATGNTDVADLSNISGYTNKEKDGDSKAVLLQASYKATDAVNQGAGVGESATSSKTYYTFSEPTFYQYGSVDANNGQYAVRYTVERGSAIRAKEPVVMALVYVGDKYLTVKVDLENTDTTDFEVVVPKATTSIQCQVLDGSTNAAWIFGRPRNEFSISANAKIVKNGAFDRLMEEAVNAAASGTWSSDINTQIFIDAGYTGVNNATRLADAQAKLVAAVNSNGGNKLSDTQANSALTGYGSFTRVK